ncbi:hypothetical protein GV829_04600 [Sphingomonas lacunae]|uniref:Terminase n=1 Tax=Sphingomonas lacunae TaxID=2698828 RepID=A0A6M4ARY4_9SPHN|nr:hypothetical protein [Sphingomonas lacunae]QJQ31815.1 hypothetical protein GV829_04600 [Sphingomonas lacunae]
MSGVERVMKPVGPVAGAFMESRAVIAGIMGPVGAGKTVASIAHCVKLASWQNAVWDPQRGCHVKKCRIAVVRDTYPNLDRTVIKSWHQWFPATMGKWSWGSPRTHNFTMTAGTKGLRGYHEIDMEMIFTAIGEHAVEDVLRGLELTGLWFNEADLLPRSAVDVGIGRIGRYPSAIEGGCAVSQIFCDFNAPDEDNWAYDLFVDQSIDPEIRQQIEEEIGQDQPLIAFYRQPGAREKGAENLHNLPKGYYAKQLVGMRADKIRRLIDNQFGAVKSGMPVYPEWNDSLHVVDKLAPVRGLPLRIGMDAGLTPAAVIGQRNALGQTLVLAELAVFIDEEDGSLGSIGPTAFGEALADLLQSRFPGFPVEWAAVDPAAAAGTDGSGNELNWLQIAAKASGLRIRPAPVPNNSLDVRLEAVRKPLSRLVEAGRPGLLVSSECKVLRRGFNSGYVFRRTALAGGDGRYENKPVKNQYSHVHDALQYLMVTSGEGRMAAAAADGGRRGSGPRVQVVGEYNPFA